MHNHTRTAYCIIRQQSHILKHVPKEALPYVARGLASTYQLPTKPFLKVMRRYARLYRTNTMHILHKGA